MLAIVPVVLPPEEVDLEELPREALLYPEEREVLEVLE